MKNFRLRIAALVAFSLFASSVQSLASAHDPEEPSAVAQEPKVALSDLCNQVFESSATCLDENAQSVCDEFGDPNVIPLASYQDCVNTCKAGIVAIEAMCRFIPDPRAKALCWAARFTTPACIGFCGWHFGK